jgi:hypothetical protein
MAVVRSLEGTFYDIPDSELDQYKVPADQVKSLMEAAGQKPPQGPPQQQTQQGQGKATGGSPQILVQFITQAPGAPQQKQGQTAPPAAEGEEEKVEPQWYWVNWANWANWYNWY